MLKGKSATPIAGLILASLASLPAYAVTCGTDPCTTVAALTDTSCAGTRHGSTLGCVANDFVVTPSVSSNTITSCHNGDQVTVDVVVGLQSSNATRYDVGVFVGQNGQSPQVNDATKLCSVATFPFTPAPWINGETAPDANTCGDYQPNGTSNNLVTGVTVTCLPDASGNLAIPYLLAYDNNKGGTCTGASDVKAGTNSKCQSGNLPFTNVVVQFNANPTCGKSVVYDPVANTITSVITITNNGPDSADGVTFTDAVPSPATVTNATCGNAQGNAVCGAVTFNSPNQNDVSGSVTTFPNGSSVDITITSTVPALPPSQTYSNTATLAVDPNVIITPVGWANTCTGQTTLPVSLQKFEVN